MSDYDVTALSSQNYRVLFYGADKLMSTLYEYYSAIRPSFDNKLFEVRECFHRYSKIDERFIKSYLKQRLEVTKLPEDDFANRQIIYKLGDSYFMSCIWYGMFNYATGYKGKEFSVVGKANDILANYIKDLIASYSLGGSKIADDRDIGKELSMSWLSYENSVRNSLYYTFFDIKVYHDIVNVALSKKLGLSEIYV